MSSNILFRASLNVGIITAPSSVKLVLRSPSGILHKKAPLRDMNLIWVYLSFLVRMVLI